MNNTLWSYHSMIAAVRDAKGVRAAASLSSEPEGSPRAVFLLGGDIRTLPGFVGLLKESGKAVFAHIELIEGIGRDSAGVRYIADCGVDGLLSTRAQLLRAARDNGLMTVQRVFLVDSDSLETGRRLLRESHADFCEVMPGLVPKAVRRLRARIEQPIIAGGMITEPEDVTAALSAGAVAVSTSQISLWAQY